MITMQQIIQHHLLPNFTAVLSAYQSNDIINTYLAQHQIDANVKTWFSSKPASATNGNSTEAVNTLLAKLEGILQTFPESTHDEVLAHLNSNLCHFWLLTMQVIC